MEQNNFILGYLTGNQLKIEYRIDWTKQDNQILYIYQVNTATHTAPSLEVQ